MGFDCVKYIITSTKSKGQESQFVYATTQIKDIDAKMFKEMKTGKSDKFSNAMLKVEGIPLKIEVKSPEMSITMVCTKIEKVKLNEADFVIPSDYKETKMFGF